MKVDQVLAPRGRLCPLPVVKAKLALEDMQPGQVLRVLAIDPVSPSVPNILAALPGMTGMATWMMRRMMRKQNMPATPEPLDMAKVTLFI